MGAEDGDRSVYSPTDLAERWGCSAWTVRQLIRSGSLEAFRVGSKLLRVGAGAVAEYEARKAVKTKTPEERAAERFDSALMKLKVGLVLDSAQRRRERRGRAYRPGP